LSPQFLLDTHIVFRWLAEPKRLSREQLRAIQSVERNPGSLAISAYSLIEFVLLSDMKKVSVSTLKQVIKLCETHQTIQLIPFNGDVASEMAAMGDSLRDPGDRVIGATARVHGLRLITADQRIIESHLVPVTE